MFGSRELSVELLQQGFCRTRDSVKALASSNSSSSFRHTTLTWQHWEAVRAMTARCFHRLAAGLMSQLYQDPWEPKLEEKSSSLDQGMQRPPS